MGDHEEQQKGRILTFDDINWKVFGELNKKYPITEHTGLSLSTLRSLEISHLKEVQAEYYNAMLQKEQAKQVSEYFFDSPASMNNRDEVEFRESCKRASDNSLQIDRVMKCSRPSSNNDEVTLHGTPYFKKPGYFQEEMLDISDRNNCPKVNLTCYTFFLIESAGNITRGMGLIEN